MDIKKLTFQFFIIIFVSILFLSSCNLSNAIDGLPTPTFSPTPRFCPTEVEYLSGEDLVLTPTLFVIIFDEEDELSGVGLEYINREITYNTLEFINKLIPEISGPGDQYSIFRFRYREYKYSRIGGFESRLSSSPLLDFQTPTPYQIPTPYPTPDYDDMEDIIRLKEKAAYERKQEAQTQEIEQALFEEQCFKTIVKTNIDATATSWALTKAAEVTEIATQLSNDDSQPVQENEVVTPFPYDEVYVGMRHVAADFDYLCANYEKCILIIFDDLVDWRNPSEAIDIPEDITYSLEKIDVIVIISDCAPIQDPICQERITRWDKKFKKLGVISTMYFDGVRLEEELSNYISELKTK